MKQGGREVGGWGGGPGNGGKLGQHPGCPLPALLQAWPAGEQEWATSVSAAEVFPLCSEGGEPL